MSAVRVEHNPSPERLRELGVEDWPVWEKEVSRFSWSYDSDETCYILDGEVTVTPDGGKPVKVVRGDLVVFPEGMSCTWDIHQDIRKHYRFG